ncbi:PEP-CTERM sorting domain-containing protein [Armatimonas sp.]|uniref:PEP-CTERM sorting domain-containing protein n=1 Tax=Armatimonas sp. TaxID=1872638 RepID=UPI00286B90AD|nr:PEP-CTERM sorting domain-containing protein [Armatimonas sp.]
MFSRSLTLIASVATMAALAPTAHAQIVATPHSYVTTLTAASPTFNRPLSGTPVTSLSGVGTAVSYGALTFIPDSTQTYTFETTAATLATGTADDTFLVLYQGSFNPASPLTNALVADDDAGVGSLSLMSRALTGGTTYILVTTTFNNGQFGPITTRISSAAPATLNLGGASAPEPGTLALLGTALVALPLIRRRKTS